MTDDLFLTREERRLLSTRLRELSDWALDALDDAVCRQVAFSDQQVKTRSSDDEQLPYNDTAGDLARETHGTLRKWVKHICTQRHRPWPGEHRAHFYAQWIDRHLIDLSLTEEADDAAAEILTLWKDVHRVIDRPVPPEFVGPCQSDDAVMVAAGRKIAQPVMCDGVYCPKGKVEFTCRTCEITIDVPTVRAATEERMANLLFSKEELRRSLLRFTKRPVSRHRLDGWIRRGRLPSLGGRYKLADALALFEDDELEPDALRMRRMRHTEVLDNSDADSC